MESLLDLEQRLDLFNRKLDGVYFWEHARLRVYFEISRALGLFEFNTQSRLRAGDVVRAATRGIGSVTRRNPMLAKPPCDLLILGYPRRQQLRDGRWSDIHLDPILQRLSHRYVYIEPSHGRRHYYPSATPQAYHHDWFDWLMLRRRGPLRWRPSAPETRQLAEIDHALTQTFDLPVSASPIIANAIGLRHCLVSGYCRLLRKLQPKLVLVISPNYREIALIEAAKTLGIRTAEIQHGVFGHLDPSYTFPRQGGARFFADDLLVYGDFWKDLLASAGCPARVVSVGFAHFESMCERRLESRRENRIVFLSQSVVGQRLTQIAVELARRPEFTPRVVYRLHPDERDWKKRYPHLRDAPIDVDDGQGQSLYATLQRARAQIGAGSFAMYEGLAMGLTTYVADLPGKEYLQPVIDAGAARCIRSAAEIPAELPARHAAFAERIFRPRAVDQVLAYFDSVLSRPSLARSA